MAQQGASAYCRQAQQRNLPEPPANAVDCSRQHALPLTPPSAIDSVAQLLVQPPSGPRRVVLRHLTVRRRRRRCKDKLCFYLVTDRLSGSEVVELRVHAGSEGQRGDMPPAAAAVAIRAITVGSVLSLAEGVFGDWSSGRGGGGGERSLSCTRVEIASSEASCATAPTLLFDLNFFGIMDKRVATFHEPNMRICFPRDIFAEHVIVGVQLFRERTG